ncbi:hypothetical protein AT960_11115 [Priestia megaterium]|uniref:AAA family ATPase n=1 Tax=Priestia megaterium TaxID=1404 RepID=UPI0007C5323F|nr:AAA family ATPase [Priestia megaterium]MCI4621419.1 NACHT domain-containing protein [Priestia megaterium]OAD47910.1 hypothetical protein AT960_11115 [Priestia megaterium]
MALNAAHRGYVYQDLVTACFFVQSIIHNYDSVAVDKKFFKGDSLDDLTLFKNNKSERRQFKYSKDRILKLDDLKKEKGSINLIDIINSHLEFKYDGEREYRLCLAWDEPIDDNLLVLLEQTDSEPSLEVLNTKCYKIKADKLWPENHKPIWDEIVELDISRDAFVKLCNILIIELDWPKASLDLTNPGLLERYLVSILEDKIGVGKYPNEDRNAIDIAATLIRLANICRAESKAITPKEITKQLGLRTDFGKVAQKNIVDLKRYVNRDATFKEFKACIKGRYTVLIGSPGSGKSWLLSMLYEELKEKYLVARHYCYLEPGDQEMQRRITSSALFGNLISDLINGEENLIFSKKSLFSVDENELNEILEEASHGHEKIYLIIDGLDHISRVFNSVTDLSKDEIDIVEKISMLNLPENVHIILGSQPGKHLDSLSTLEEVNYYEMPKWKNEDTGDLFEKYELKEKIETLVDSTEEFYSKLNEKTEGNPLYITFLIKRLLIDIEKKIIDIDRFLKDLPKIEGDIRNYYEYLILSTEDSGAIFIGEVLALVDFGLTERELKEIFPPYARLVAKALDLLAPVLINVSVQGGVRVYHESFRRYITEKLEEDGIPLYQIITPVIDWLTKKDFFMDSKAYQFLLSMLRRAKLFNEIEKIVNKEFVINSIAHCHPKKAVEQNLIIASNVAQNLNDYVFQIRIVELKKSLYTAYEEKLGNIELYAETFASLHGYGLLAQRLIFDGQITFDVESGIILCNIIDNNAEVAPWAEYCEAYQDLEQQDDLEVALAFFKGVLKTESWDDKKQKLIEWFSKQKEKSNYLYIRGIIKILLEFELEEFIYSLLDLDLYEKVKEVVRFELIQFLVNKDKAKANKFIRNVSPNILSAEVALLCSKLDKTISLEHVVIEQPKDIGLYIGSHIPESNDISKWVKSIRLCAAKQDEITLNAELNRVRGEGWYKKWLEFIIKTAEIEFHESYDEYEKERGLLDAFYILENIASPFQGKPRACDLHSIENSIFTSFKEAMEYIVTEECWSELTSILESISKKTTTYLMGTPMGPLTSSKLLELLNLFTNKENAKHAIGESVKRLTNKASNNGEYFEIQAEHGMYYSMIMKKLGNKEEAFLSWKRVCRYLTSYGFHKDATIYELLDGVEPFLRLSNDWVKEKLFDVLPLLNKVVVHTDEKEVKYIHNNWFSLLVEVDFSLAVNLLSRSIKARGGRIDWRLDDALEKILLSSDRLLPPEAFIVAVLSCSIPLNNNQLIKKLLKEIKHLSDSAPIKAQHLYILVKARVFEDDLNQEIISIMNSFEEHEKEFRESQKQKEEIKKKHIEDNKIKKAYREFTLNISNSSPLEIILYIRELKNEELCSDQFINAIGYKLLSYLDSNNNSEVLKVIDLLAKKYRFYPKELIYTFKSLMEGFERHNMYEPAIYLAILQFTRVYENSWKAFGGKEIVPKIEKYYESHAETVQQFLQKELVNYIEKETPSFGVTSNLIYLFKSINSELAMKLWQEAFDIIDLRLRTEKDFSGPFIELDEKEVITEDIENVIELVFSRMTHPELKRKSWALWGIHYYYFNYENEFISALKEFIKTDIYESMFEIILSLLLEKEIPTELTNFKWPEYFLKTRYYSINKLTQMVLNLEKPLSSNDSIERNKEVIKKPIDESILSLDKVQSAIKLQGYLPRVVERVCLSFEKVFDNNETYIKRMRDMYNVFTESRDRILPKVDYWGIENEIYKQVLNREVFNYSSSHSLLLTNLLNDLRIPITMHDSKVRRPPSIESDLDNNFLQKTQLEGFEDWIRLASIQNEVILDDYSSNMKYVRKTYQGSIANILEDSNDSYLPFEKQENLDWWYIDESSYFNLEYYKQRALIRYSKLYNDFGAFHILKLDDAIINELKLKTAEFPGPFNLVDQKNEIAVAFRNWQYDLIGSDLSEETYRIVGFELVMRPDIYKRLLKIFRNQIYQVTEVVS